MRILIVEDDPMLGDGLHRGLKLMGHAADWFRTAAEADRAIAAMHYDAVLLDLGLPDEDGVTMLLRWRNQGRHTPVVILTARDAVQDRIGGLDAGADDYLIKPVDLDELAARLRAVSRRAAGMLEPVWRHGPLEYHPAARLAVWHGKSVDLTSRESMLLELLLTHPNRVLTREFLRDKLYEWEKGSESNTLEVHIHHLRRKLHPGIVRTLRGAGYTLGTVDALAAPAPDAGDSGDHGDGGAGGAPA
ncbi:response regulator [Cupriavidus sp. H18C2]|uniref:response regulator n=1 Tax=Cupriavidus sp. H18C2 TaxID=3241602 RepID=UPI003BF7BCE3